MQRTLLPPHRLGHRTEPRALQPTAHNGRHQVDLRSANEEYLEAHPELQTMISLFMKNGEVAEKSQRGTPPTNTSHPFAPSLPVLEKQPADAMSFACKWFTDPEREDEVGGTFACLHSASPAQWLARCRLTTPPTAPCVLQIMSHVGGVGFDMGVYK